MTETAIDTSSSIGIEHVFDYEVQLAAPVVIGAGAFGNRVFWEVRGGRISGPRLNGEVLSGGGDWALVGDDGWTRLDVRGQCRTDDDAFIYFRARGVVEQSAALAEAVAAGGATRFEDQYFRVALELETGDPRYAWLTRSLLVGQGRVCSGPGVSYRVFRIS
jgi:uncharacterized protein DUF3237